MIRLVKSLTGTILDIGGGGEGIIGRIYGKQVTAIDNRREELDEAPEGFAKLLMDACALDFTDGSFDHVTFFYTMMFIPKDRQMDALREACRVLRPGGTLEIWDAAFEKAEPFVTELDIDAAGERLHTTYGIWEKDAAQDSTRFQSLCGVLDLSLEECSEMGEHFYLRFRK